MSSPVLYVGQRNPLVAAFWKTFEERTRYVACPSDELIELSPLERTAAEDALAVARGGVSGGPRRAASGSGVRRDASASAPSSSCPPILTGGLQSNSTPSQAPQRPDDMPNYAGGYDGGCRVYFWGEWFAESEREASDFFTNLAYYKHAAVDADENGDEYVYMSLDGSPWRMLPKGDNGNQRFTYQLQRGGVTLQIGRNPRPGNADVGVVYGYEALFGRDLKDVHNETRQLLAALGFTTERESLRRVDINVTLATPFDWVQKAFESNRIVSRVRSWQQYTNKTGDGYRLETLSGGTQLQVCMYDKMRELLVKRNEQKHEDLKPLLEPFDAEPALTRIEFRFKTEALRVYEIETVDEFTARIADVVDYVTSKWLRVLEVSKIRGMENRQEISREWRWVQYAFWAAFCTDKKSSQPLKRRTSKEIDKKNLFAQALGCLSSAFAYDLNVDKTLNFNDFLAELLDSLYRLGPELYKQYLTKRCWFNVRRGAPIDVASEFATRPIFRPVADSVPF